MTAHRRHTDDYKCYSDSSSSDIRHVKSSRAKVPLRCPESSRLAPLDRFAAKYAIKKRASPDYTIDKLNQLIGDPVTSNGNPRIGRLLEDFLRDVGDDFPSKDTQRIEHVTVIGRVLEFLAQSARKIEKYEIYLERMLELCKVPPLLRKTSDRLRCDDVLEQYFSTLASLLLALQSDREILVLLKALRSLLVVSESADARSSCSVKLCHEAMKKSKLALSVTKLSENSSSVIYRGALELALLLAEISNDCCYAMLQAGFLDRLLVRMNGESESALHLRDAPRNDENARPSKENVILTTSIVWSLIRSILHPSTKLPPDFIDKLSGPSIQAMTSLRNVFRYQVRHSEGKTIDGLILRNDLAVLILAASVALPSLDLVRCGLAEDLIVLSILLPDETASIDGTWIENISFDTADENLIFKKIMLAVLYHLSSRDAAISMMVKRGVIPAILEMTNPGIDRETRWSSTQFWYLWQFAMRTLARLAIKMPEEFARNEGSARLLMLVEWSLGVEFDAHIAMEFTKTICSLVTSKCSSIIMNFREEGIVLTLHKLVERILTFDCLTMQHQRILTLLMITIEEAIKAERSFARRCDYESLDTAMKLLNRCFYQRKEDFPLDQRLLIAIGSYIWECVVHCDGMSEKFVDNGGIYTILDVIESASFPVRCVYLGILTDIWSNRYGAPYFCTWRGRTAENKTKGFVSLLAKCWREEEIRTGVKRTADGCIDDVELPIMGTEQWINAFHARATHDFSPTLASLLGSVRPKIYSLRKIMIDDADLYQKSREHYKILLHDLPVEDHITMYIVDHFYRFAQGQLWSEISRYLEQIGVNILGMDGETMLLMNQRHREWGMYVRGLQEKLLRAEKKRETERERDEIARIRNSRLGAALSALGEIDYIRRTTERDYAITKKQSQRDRINAALSFPELSDSENCHRTFYDKWNFTTILEQNHTIPSAAVSADTRSSLEITDALSISSASSSAAFEKVQAPPIRLKKSASSLSDKCSPPTRIALRRN